MLILMVALGVFAAVRAVRAGLALLLRGLPRCNEDLVWY